MHRARIRGSLRRERQSSSVLHLQCGIPRKAIAKGETLFYLVRVGVLKHRHSFFAAPSRGGCLFGVGPFGGYGRTLALVAVEAALCAAACSERVVLRAGDRALGGGHAWVRRAGDSSAVCGHSEVSAAVLPVAASMLEALRGAGRAHQERLGLGVALASPAQRGSDGGGDTGDDTGHRDVEQGLVELPGRG